MMIVRKCDVCKKKIPTGYDNRISASAGFDTFEFCQECGAKVLRVLKGYKLLKKEPKFLKNGKK
jgi:hypothetical protein